MAKTSSDAVWAPSHAPIQCAIPTQIVGQIGGSDAPETLQPALEAAVVGVDVLDVPRAKTTFAAQRVQTMVFKTRMASCRCQHGAATGT